MRRWRSGSGGARQGLAQFGRESDANTVNSQKSQSQPLAGTGPMSGNPDTKGGGVPNSAERRRYTRYPIELAGRLAVRGAGRQPCVVRDYCGGGLLLQQPAAARPVPGLAVGDPLELTVDLFTGRGIEPTALSGRVAWVNGEYLGLAFQQPSDALVAVLRRHDRLARGDQQRTATQSGGEVRCLAKLRHVAQGALPSILRELLA